jgi:hypothetical protein
MLLSILIFFPRILKEGAVWALIGDIKKGKVCSIASFEEKKRIPRKRSLSWNLIHFVDQRKETALCRIYVINEGSGSGWCCYGGGNQCGCGTFLSF